MLLSKIQESARRAGLAEEFEMTETWAQAVFSEGRQQGIEEGREQGLRRGRMEAAQDALLDLLRAKFGTVSANVTEHVREIADAEELQRLLRSVVAASSMAEMGLQEP